MIEIIPNWHPLFVHFTVALFSLSVLFFILQLPLAITEIGDNFLVFARYSLTLGIAFTILTVIAGADAYNTVAHDTSSHLAMKEHRLWALITAAIFLSAWLWSLVSLKGKEKAGVVLILMLIAGAGCLFVTGQKGSLLVFKHGLGVESLPQVGKHSYSDHEQGKEPNVGTSQDDGMKEDSHDGKHKRDAVQTQSGESEDESNPPPTQIPQAKTDTNEHSQPKQDTLQQGVVGTATGTSSTEDSASKKQESSVVVDKDGISQEALPEVNMPKQKIKE